MVCCHLALPNKVSILALWKPFVCVARLLVTLKPGQQYRKTVQRPPSIPAAPSTTLQRTQQNDTKRRSLGSKHVVHELCSNQNAARYCCSPSIHSRISFQEHAWSVHCAVCMSLACHISTTACVCSVVCMYVACSENMFIASGIVLCTTRLL